MIERLKRYLNIRSLEDAVVDFSSILEKESTMKLELDLLANDFQSVSKSFENQLKDEKDVETKEFIKSKSETFTSNYLSQLVEKKKGFDKIQSEKKSLLNLYPQLEKAVIDWKREQFIHNTLSLYRSGKIELDDCDMIIKASTKEKVKYSDNLVFNEKGELLIVQRGPLDENGPNLWVLPGGHVDTDEKHEAAAKREVLEETGYEIKDCYHVGSFTDDKVYIEYYSSMVDTTQQSPTVDANETRYTEFIPVKDLYKYPTIYNMWDRVYEILGIDQKVIVMKKSIVDELVSGEKIEELINKSINIGGEIKKKEFDKIMKASKDGFLTALTQSKSFLHSSSIDIPLDESNDKELLRLSIAAELDAINLYEKMAEKAQSSKIKKVLLDVAKEEKTHIGEFEALLKDIDKEHKEELEEGAKEVEEIEKAKKLGHLIPKKVQIKGKDGKIYNAIRWVNPETGESEKYSDKLREKKAIEGTTFEDSLEKIMSSDLPKSDKVRNLVNLGIYDSSLLTLLTGEPTPGYFLKESDIDVKDLPDNSEAVKDIVRKQQQDNDTPQERQTNTLLRDISIEELWDNYERNLRRVARGRHKFAVAYGSGGVGKAQPLYSKVLTPTGFRTMGELVVGDEVLTPRGEVSKILEVFPQGQRPVYELTFIDGRKCRCDEDHIWHVRERVSYSWRNLTLKQMLEKGLRIGSMSNGEWRYGVPFMKKPIIYEDRPNLKIDPWLLGFLLGDGCLSRVDIDGSIGFSVGERDREFILSKVEEILREYSLQTRHRSQNDYSIVLDRSRCTRNVLGKYIKELNLAGTYSYTKFIPEEYIRSSIEDRLALIQGLMDSDGYVIDGTCILSLTSERLVKQFREIVLSLGASFVSYSEDSGNFDKGIGKMCYSLTFVLPDGLMPVTLPFKLNRYIKRKPNYKKALSLVRVEYIGEEETKCILIDSEDHLYITDDYIVTHNTYIFRQIAKQLELREYDDEIQPSKDQYDFVVISGKITPTQVYAEMYRHRDKLIVFDDCDSFLQTEEVQGFLKAGLDTGEQTKISNKSSKKVYNIEGDPESGTIPNTFAFKGRVIAITNLVARQLDQAVKSRALCVNLTMTVDETIDKLGTIKDKIDILTADKSETIDIPQKARDFAFEVLKKNKDKLGGDINTRVYSNAVLIASDGIDDKMAEDKIEREIVSYFDSVTGNFDEMIRKIKGK